MTATSVHALSEKDGTPVRNDSDGKSHAFDDLYRCHFTRLARFCRRLTKDSALAEDIAQETMLRALTHLEELDADRPLWPWLKTIAARLACDEYRKGSHVVPLEPDRAYNASDQDAMTWIEEAPPLLQAMARLPQRQRAALSLRYLEDKDPAEVARSFELAKPAFEQLLFRARNRLRTEYQRVCGTAGGLLVFPSRWLRRAVDRVAWRSRFGTSLGANSPTLSPVTDHLATGLFAFFVMLGGIQVVDAPANPDLSANRLPAMLTQPFTGSFGPRGAPPAPSKYHQGGRLDRPAHGENDARHPTPGRVAKDLTDPNRGVRKPEDTRVTSVIFAADSSGQKHRTAYAIGITHCRLPSCPPVLFRSNDDGATWERLEAKRLSGATVLLPPDYGRKGQRRVFAMGPSGLQVSENGGRSFHHAAVSGSSFAAGSAAISPVFHRGDPTILIGAQNLMRYRDDQRTIEPERSTALPGPLEPSFAPSYPDDPRLLIGGMRFDSARSRVRSTVFICSSALCSETYLTDYDQIPKLRPAKNFATTGLVYAFTQNRLFKSVNDGRGFSIVRTPWNGGLLRDVLVARNGDVLFAAVDAIKETEDQGLYVSTDAGGSWHRVSSPLFSDGASIITVDDRRTLVARATRGLACSSDHGRTWHTRCEAP